MEIPTGKTQSQVGEIDKKSQKENNKWSYVNILKNLTSESPSVPQTPAGGYSSSEFMS